LTDQRDLYWRLYGTFGSLCGLWAYNTHRISNIKTEWLLSNDSSLLPTDDYLEEALTRSRLNDPNRQKLQSIEAELSKMREDEKKLFAEEDHLMDNSMKTMPT
jgi:hypothetical protein